MKEAQAASKKVKNLGLRRAFLLLIPLVLVICVWKVQEVQKPISIEIPSPGLERIGGGGFGVKKQKIPVFHQLVVRLVAEQQKHPFAASIARLEA